MWISEFWYEKLPAIYVLSGLLVLTAFGPKSPAALSAVLLFAAAMLIRSWRSNARTKTRLTRKAVISAINHPT